MIQIPAMLLIGSTGRNAGKTEFACRVIRKHSANADIVGVKVTSVSRTDGTCPRGGKGCGSCSSLTDGFGITDEAAAPPGKDTGRLLAAGASRVLWLRVLRTHLHEGVAALLQAVGQGRMIVCESNSVRQAAQPGLFLMVRNSSSDACKETAAQVMERADRIVASDGIAFDPEPEAIHIENGAWALQEKATAIVMAGGKASRMGTDKTLLPVRGKPLIEHVLGQLRPHFEEVLISSRDSARYDGLRAQVVPDRAPDQGPLMGLASSLRASTSELNLVVACDIPDVDIRFARRMLREAEGWDVVVARSGERLEPLFAVYRKALADKMDDLLAAGHRKVRSLFEHCRVKYVDLPPASPLENLNTMDEYLAYVGGSHGAIMESVAAKPGPRRRGAGARE